jgi:membrane fusion protein, multidrug efflux system
MKAGRIVAALLSLAVLAGGALAFQRARAGAAKPAAQRDAGSRPVPVAIAAVGRRDVPVYLEGIGSASALNTVSVRSQVDGRLERVFFKEGQAVKKGELLAQIDPRPYAISLHQAQAAAARDAAVLANGKLNLERYSTLRQQNLVPQQQVDDQRAQVAQLEAAVRLDQAQASAARLQLDYARVTAPIDGVTGLRQIDPGNLVRAADATGIVVIAQIDPIGVLFTLPQDELPRVVEKMAEGPVAVDALSRDGATTLGSGVISLIDNQINPSTATIRIKATFANEQRRLWPNQFVKARVLLATRKGALVIPTVAVLRGPKGPFVYVVAADQTVEQRPVQTSPGDGEVTIVEAGLTEGEQIVTDGQHKLKPGARVSSRGGRP